MIQGLCLGTSFILGTKYNFIFGIKLVRHYCVQRFKFGALELILNAFYTAQLRKTVFLDSVSMSPLVDFAGP